MGDKSEQTKQRILAVAKEEFSDKGFMGASLRIIAEKASVTTGALYGIFSDKNHLFNELVYRPAESLCSMYENEILLFNNLQDSEKLKILDSFNDSYALMFVNFIYDNFDEFKLIVMSSGGTIYEQYIDKLITLETRSMVCFFKILKQNGSEIPELRADLIHMLVSSYFNGMFEVVAHDMKKEDAIEYVLIIAKFFHCGWKNLFKIQ